MSDLEPISRADLENSVTQAQYTVCLQHLRDLVCPVCTARKEYYRCFCKACYFCLPFELRTPLWIERETPVDLAAFVQGYIVAKRYLREEMKRERDCA